MIQMSYRALVFALSVFAVINLPASASASASASAAERPVQGWATKSGLVTLLPQNAVQTTKDPMARLLIEDAFSRYAMAVDEGRHDVLSSLFTDDVHLDVVEASKTPLVSVSGRDAVVANFAAAWKQQGDQRRHLISNFVFNKLTADRAEVVAYAVVVVANDDLSVGASVIYTADFRRGPDGLWRFSRILIGMDKYMGQKPNPKK